MEKWKSRFTQQIGMILAIVAFFLIGTWAIISPQAFAPKYEYLAWLNPLLRGVIVIAAAVEVVCFFKLIDLKIQLDILSDKKVEINKKLARLNRELEELVKKQEVE